MCVRVCIRVCVCVCVLEVMYTSFVCMIVFVRLSYPHSPHLHPHSPFLNPPPSHLPTHSAHPHSSLLHFLTTTPSTLNHSPPLHLHPSLPLPFPLPPSTPPYPLPSSFLPPLHPPPFTSYADYEFLSDRDITEVASKTSSRYSLDSLRGVIFDVQMLSECDYLVCTFSSQVCHCSSYM